MPIQCHIMHALAIVMVYYQAFGAAGGILAITAFCSKLYLSLLVSIIISRTFDSTDLVCCCPPWLVCAAIFIAIFVIFVIFLGLNVGIPEVRATVFHTMTDIIYSVCDVLHHHDSHYS